MANEDLPDIFSASLNELRMMAEWANSNDHTGSPAFILYGGWGVYSYNPWYGSVDIDIILNNRVKKKFVRGFVKSRGFDIIGGAGLKQISKSTPHGMIILDVKMKGVPYRFEGQDASNALELGFLDDNVTTRQIAEGIDVTVPNLESLIILKLKAVWDRCYRIEHHTSKDLEWDSSKLTKDKCDVIALLDPGVNDLNPFKLGDLIEKYPFLTSSLKSCVDEVSIDRYGRFPEDAGDFIHTLIDLMGV